MPNLTSRVQVSWDTTLWRCNDEVVAVIYMACDTSAIWDVNHDPCIILYWIYASNILWCCNDGLVAILSLTRETSAARNIIHELLSLYIESTRPLWSYNPLIGGARSGIYLVIHYQCQREAMGYIRPHTAVTINHTATSIYRFRHHRNRYYSSIGSRRLTILWPTHEAPFQGTPEASSETTSKRCVKQRHPSDGRWPGILYCDEKIFIRL
jgi:hypothetical protein